MGVVLTEHLTNDARTFLIRLRADVVNVHHAVEDTAVYGLKAVANIGEGTSHNHRHRVVDVGGLHLLLDVNLNDSVVVECLIHCDIYYLLIYIFRFLLFTHHFSLLFAFKALFSPSDAFSAYKGTKKKRQNLHPLSYFSAYFELSTINCQLSTVRSATLGDASLAKNYQLSMFPIPCDFISSTISSSVERLKSPGMEFFSAAAANE